MFLCGVVLTLLMLICWWSWSWSWSWWWSRSRCESMLSSPSSCYVMSCHVMHVPYHTYPVLGRLLLFVWWPTETSMGNRMHYHRHNTTPTLIAVCFGSSFVMTDDTDKHIYCQWTIILGHCFFSHRSVRPSLSSSSFFFCQTDPIPLF